MLNNNNNNLSNKALQKHNKLTLFNCKFLEDSGFKIKNKRKFRPKSKIMLR